MSNVKIKKDFTTGNLFFPIILFALPIMLTGVLQLFYNMADTIILGRLSADQNAIGAVGSTASLNNFLINFVFGTSGGTGIIVAQHFGAKQYDEVNRAVHTAMSFALLLGGFLMAVGLLASRVLITAIGTRELFVDSALLYFRIICLGIPANAVYNFGASILRSVGDSRTPLIILSSSGLLNVILNVVFIVAFSMTVDGVAIATIASQYVSAVAVCIVLIRRNECYRLSFKKLKIEGRYLKRILRYGIPGGIQGSLFSITNLLLVRGINSLSDAAVKANTVTVQLDNVTYTSCTCFYHAAMTFTGQNYGAKKISRIRRTFFYCALQTFIVGCTVGTVELLFVTPLAKLFLQSTDPMLQEILFIVKDVATVVLPTYFLCGLMEVCSGVLKGMGYSLLPMFICLVSICGLRLFWLECVFPLEAFHSSRGLFTCYPVTWSAAILVMSIAIFISFFRLKKRFNRESRER